MKYADDTAIYLSDKSVCVIEEKITDDLFRIATWLEENELIINLKKGKTECMLFGT